MVVSTKKDSIDVVAAWLMRRYTQIEPASFYASDHRLSLSSEDSSKEPVKHSLTHKSFFVLLPTCQPSLN